MARNKRFDQRIENILAEIWSKIAQIDELKGRWVAGAQLSPQVLGRLKKIERIGLGRSARYRKL